MPEDKIDNAVLKLRERDFETGECEYCRYFSEPSTCKVLVGPVDKEKVCDAFQGGDDFEKYQVADKDMDSFGKGMVKAQPYQHKVLQTINTPVGWLVIIEDTMKPKVHTFSIDIKFHMEHTAREHHWTQEEVDELIKTGSKSENDRVDKILATKPKSLFNIGNKKEE